MIDFARCLPAALFAQVRDLVSDTALIQQHGDWCMWQDEIRKLPQIQPSCVVCNDVISIGSKTDAGDAQSTIAAFARRLVPWRKGPFSLFGIEIDGEWRSEKKWHRLAPHLDCADKAILDVGANNGYYMFRLGAMGAASVVGLDAQLKAAVQFYMLQQYAQQENVVFVPLRLETIADATLWRNQFDLVLALGTLYHARNPILHLMQLQDRLVRGGRLLLETLVINDAKHTLITPETTYMRMKNVWFVTSVDIVCIWLERLGFCDVCVLDVTQTETDEQRQTEWMPFASLQDGLHLTDMRLTTESLPRAQRALISATK